MLGSQYPAASVFAPVVLSKAWLKHAETAVLNLLLNRHVTHANVGDKAFLVPGLHLMAAIHGQADLLLQKIAQSLCAASLLLLGS